MKKSIIRLIGLLLVLAAMVGIILGIAGVFFIWKEKAAISASVNDSLALLEQTLTTTQNGLLVLDSTLENAAIQISKIQATSARAADTLATTYPTLDSIADLFGNKLTNVVTDTQLSLSAAEASATLIDDTLGIISAIPIIGARYEPDPPLATSIDQISESLGALPASFSEIEQNLSSTSTNLLEVQKDIEEMYASLGDISTNLKDAQSVVEEYQRIVTRNQNKVDTFQVNFPQHLERIALGITLILVWVAIASFGLLTQGMELIKSKK